MTNLMVIKMSNFIHPCPGAKITSPFGKRIISGKPEWHQGIDLAKTGTVKVLAAAAGTIIRAGVLGTYGNVVIIQHTINGIRMDTTYAHLRDGSLKVKKGDKVKQGQVIGLMGNTGRSYGQHLHFEIHYGPWLTGQPNAIDPWPYINSIQVKMKVSKECLNLIKKWEGFQAKAYLCQANVWSIGYGTTKYANGNAVKKGDTITQEEALTLFEKQVNEHSSTILNYVKVPLSQAQFDALASFQYNLGKHILKDSKLLEYLNNQEWDKACNQMLLYNKANGKVSTGLVNRRKDEVAMFNSEKEDDDYMSFSSPTLKAETETTLASKARRQIIVDEAVTAGANKSIWQEKLDNGTITNADLLGLAAKALISKK